MLSISARNDLYEELSIIFKSYGYDFTRYEILDKPNMSCVSIQMYFQVYDKPYGLAYEWSTYQLQEFTKLNLKLMLIDYLHKQLKAIDKTEHWELVPKT